MLQTADEAVMGRTGCGMGELKKRGRATLLEPAPLRDAQLRCSRVTEGGLWESWEARVGV